MATTVDLVDEALRHLVTNKRYETARDFHFRADTLLDRRLRLTKPDTGDVPTREAHDGSARTSARPQGTPA